MAERPKAVTIYMPAGYERSYSRPQELKDRLVTSSSANRGDWMPKPQAKSSTHFAEEGEEPPVETKCDPSEWKGASGKAKCNSNSSPGHNVKVSHAAMLISKSKQEQYKGDTASNSSSSSSNATSPESVSTNPVSTHSSRMRRSLEKGKDLLGSGKLSSLAQSKPEANPSKGVSRASSEVCSPNNDKGVQTIWHIDINSTVPDVCNIEPNDRIITPRVYEINNKQEETIDVSAKIASVDSTWAVRKSSPSESQLVKSEPQQPELGDLKFAQKVDSDDDWGSADEGFSQSDVKSGCGCDKCDKWLSCPEWCQRNTFFEADKKKQIKNLKPFLRPADSQPAYIDVEKKVLNRLLIHGANTMKPVESLNQVPFNKVVKEFMEMHNYAEPKGIQKFLWPVILRRINVFYVGNPSSGKTMAYLPSICTFAMERDDNYKQFSTYPGPLILILAEDKNACFHIQKMARTLLGCTANSPVVEVLGDGSSEPIQRNVDVLISTPGALEDALIAESVSLKRVVHLVIDDGEMVLKNFGAATDKILNLLNEILVRRPRNKLIHTVVSSAKWSSKLETLLKKLYSPPLVYIANQYEAALYGNVHFVKKDSRDPNYKVSYLIDTLHKQAHHYTMKKTIVFCKENEMADLADHLLQNGVETISVGPQMEDEITAEIGVWNHLAIRHYKVLLCTDGLSKYLSKIKNSDCLVHYCLPEKWSHFVERFQPLLGNITSPLEGVEERKTCFIIADEKPNQQSAIVGKYFDSLTRMM